MGLIVYRIFISHASEDKGLALLLAAHLKVLDFDVYIDERDIHTGMDFTKEIHDNIAQSQELIVLLSPRSVKKPFIPYEIALARHCDLHISPLVLGMTIPEFSEDLTFRGILDPLKCRHIDNILTFLEELSTRVSRQTASEISLPEPELEPESGLGGSIEERITYILRSIRRK
jgi:hypothetical protein